MLKLMFWELKMDSSASTKNESIERCWNYCLSKGDIELWQDFHAASNRSTQEYKAFFDIAEEFIEDIFGAHPYRHTCKNYLSNDDADLVSVSALHENISEKMKLNNKDQRTEYEIPSEWLPWISMCPQYESRAVSKHYWCQLNSTRVFLTATMKKSNFDYHCYHKLKLYWEKNR